MEYGESLTEEDDDAKQIESVERAFGAENRNRLIDLYFAKNPLGPTSGGSAWEHAYRLLLWSDPTTGLAHCYESDKCQPGKPWYARSLAFHDWICSKFGIAPTLLSQEIDYLFIEACRDLSATMLRKQVRLAEVAAVQRKPYELQGFPEPGSDPELTELISAALQPYLSADPSPQVWGYVTQQVRQFLSVQNKRKNLVGEGFEDVLAQIVRRSCGLPTSSVRTRCLLHEIPGFNRARQGAKENRVDLAILNDSKRTLVTAKWSVRADREKQFPTEYEEYINAESENKRFSYVFVTNEFDPARLMRACESLHRNSLMFDHVVHINTDAIVATYGGAANSEGRLNSSRAKVVEYIKSGRLISIDQWLKTL
jgi:hypothetical protein